MKVMIRVALTAISLASIGPAYAGDGDGNSATTRFTIIANQQAHVPAPGRVGFAGADYGVAVRRHQGS